MPTVDSAFRTNLLDYFIANQTSAELADWLRGLGKDASGTVEQRRQRVRENTKYLSMPADGFPVQTRRYLDSYSSDHLADICLALGLPDGGTKDSRYRRIMREVGYRELWLSRHESPSPPPDVRSVAAILQWYPVQVSTRGKYEKDFYGPLYEELSEAFAPEWVHQQRAIAHGTTLKIDFHVGHPQSGGVGVEVKMPTNNADVQRALGQTDQYIAAYGDQLVMLILPDFVSSQTLTPFLDQLRAKNVSTVVKSPDTY